MLYKFNEVDLRSICRRNIENFERWARRLIDEQYTKHYGTNWIDFKLENNEFLIKNKLRNTVSYLKNQDNERFNRTVDALFLEDIIYLLCTDKFYKLMFKDILVYSYPQGNNEVREFLERLIPIRNKLSHSNPISIREAEKAICYTNDFIDGVKEYYKKEGKEKMYNVPTIIRIIDSLGNEFNTNQISRNSTGRGHCDASESYEIRSGDKLTIEASIDPAFDESTYSVSWLFKNNWHDGNKIVLELDDSCVRIDFTLYCKVISNVNDWHRCGDVDDSVGITYRVFPQLS